MSTLTQRVVEHVFEALRNGLVPERGIDTFAADHVDSPIFLGVRRHARMPRLWLESQ